MAEEAKEKKDSSRAGKDYLQDERIKIFLDHIAGKTDMEISRDLKRPIKKTFSNKRKEIVREETINLAEVATSFLYTAAHFKMQYNHLKTMLSKMGIHVKPYEISDEHMKSQVEVILEGFIQGEDWLNID